MTFGPVFLIYGAALWARGRNGEGEGAVSGLEDGLSDTAEAEKKVGGVCCLPPLSPGGSGNKWKRWELVNNKHPSDGENNSFYLQSKKKKPITIYFRTGL